MSNINTVAVSGNLTRDPELRHTPSGTAIANLSVAVNRSRKQDDGSYQDEVSFFDLTAFGNFAELISRKLRKADSVSVLGRLEQQRWETEDGSKRSKVVIIVQTIDSASFYKKDDEVAPMDAGEPAAQTGTQTQLPADDDIPF